jgi:subtilisin family serine protease
MMDTTGRRIRQVWKLGVATAVTSVSVVAPLGAASAPAVSGDLTAVIVQENPGAGNAPERAVSRVGGRVVRQIPLIHGFSAKVPSSTLAALRAVDGVRAVTPDQRVTLSTPVDGWEPTTDAGSPYNLIRQTGARTFWMRGYTGSGIDVAVVDSGVSPVEGLATAGKVINGPDLSFDSQSPEHTNTDGYGHGTHMAGLIAGDDSVPGPSSGRFSGMAPGARVVSVKVADGDGAADVSQVIAGIDWVIQHRNTDGMNIRVLNLSFGTDGVQDYRTDPLAYAVEAAWRKGIVVVVSGGNAGFGSAKLNNPAYDPYVLAIGAQDPKGTVDVTDDEVPAWSSAGDGLRNPDLVAPGKSLVSLRVPGSTLDVAHPEGRVGVSRFFRGSGTSQAAAVVSGGVALVLSRRPWLTPDQVKAVLTGTAVALPKASSVAQGAGAMDLNTAYYTRSPAAADVAQTWPVATGTGSIDRARGTLRLDDEGLVLDGERDIFGNTWDGATWSDALWNGRSWQGGAWNGVTWTGSSWAGASWSGTEWTGRAWSGRGWAGRGWSGRGWLGRAWSGRAWSGSAWGE